MAKKITRATLNELAKEMALLSEQEQQAYLGGGSGTEIDPYTYDEYLQMSASGNWKGGYVELGQHWDSHMSNSGSFNGNKEMGIGYLSSSHGGKFSYDDFERMVAVGEWKGGVVIHRDGSTKYLSANAKDPDGIINHTGIYEWDVLFTLGYKKGYDAGKSPGLWDDGRSFLASGALMGTAGDTFQFKSNEEWARWHQGQGILQGLLDGWRNK